MSQTIGMNHGNIIDNVSVIQSFQEFVPMQLLKRIELTVIVYLPAIKAASWHENYRLWLT